MSISNRVSKKTLYEKDHGKNENSYYESKADSNSACSRRHPLKVLPTYFFTDATPKNKQTKENQSLAHNKSYNNGIAKKKSLSKKDKKKSMKRSNSFVNKKKPVNYLHVENFEAELEKLMRAVFRHCIGCPKFKTELTRVNADTLLNHYASSRL